METHVVEEERPGEMRQLLEDRINDHNVVATGIGDGEVVALAIRDGTGALAAGLFGWTWGGTLFVEFLWVGEARRGRGDGSRLLRTAEGRARERGCAQALLSTRSFQAPGFYLVHGYEVYGVADNYPSGHKQYHLRKTLA